MKIRVVVLVGIVTLASRIGVIRMSSVEDRQNSENGQYGQAFSGGSLQMPGLVTQLSPVNQLSFPNTVSPIPPASQPAVTSPLTPLTPFQSSAGGTRPLPQPLLLPNVTRNLSLTETQTGALTSVKNTTTALRQPVVIPRTGKVSRGTMRPPKGRRWVMHLSATVVLVLIAIGTLMTVLPAGSNGEAGFNPFQPILNFATGGNSNPNLLAQQAATVTAVTQDGYESGKTTTYAGLPTPPPGVAGTSGYDGFTYGQCTYWADYLYHQMTGFWVPWGGNAWQWAGGAAASGWVVSSTPHVPSIIVLQPYVQGAGGYGHVAVVIGINADGSVHTSNWNWYANGGGWARTSYWDFRPGPGVSFVWK